MIHSGFRASWILRGFALFLSLCFFHIYAAAQCGPCPCSDGVCSNCYSPIIIDTRGAGFHLTSAEDGVVFDIVGDGHPIRIAWTAADSGTAFLALDRNHNGKIDNGKELFGNFTAQPPLPGWRQCLPERLPRVSRI